MRHGHQENVRLEGRTESAAGREWSIVLAAVERSQKVQTPQ